MHKMKKIGVYIGIAVGLMAWIAIIIAFLWIHWCKKKKKQSLRTNCNDVEQQQQQQQQLSLSIRTTSDKKISFEGSQYTIDQDHKTRLESYTFEDLQKATQDFSQCNLIQSSVFHGRLKGKKLAIKRVSSSEATSKMHAEIFHGNNPKMIRLLGTCVMNGPDSFLVLEFAGNGSLKDWIHGGLAMKSHFVDSCSCFLTWDQRVRICADVATALNIMHPGFVHGKVKSGNIFLDEDFGAKLGLPDVSDDEEEGCLCPSMDVFDYGVVLLEVLSGKALGAVKMCDEIREILGSENGEELRGWIDGALGENYSFDGAVKLANIARACVEEDLLLRPSAGEVVEKVMRLVQEMAAVVVVVGVGEEFSNVCESSCRPLVM